MPATKNRCKHNGFAVLLKPAGHALEPTGAVLDTAGAALEPTGVVLEPTGSVLEPTGATLDPHPDWWVSWSWLGCLADTGPGFLAG